MASLQTRMPASSQRSRKRASCGIVAPAHEVAAQVPQLLDVGEQQLLGHGMAKLRVRLVAVEAQQPHRLVVDPNLLAPRRSPGGCRSALAVHRPRPAARRACADAAHPATRALPSGRAAYGRRAVLCGRQLEGSSDRTVAIDGQRQRDSPMAPPRHQGRQRYGDLGRRERRRHHLDGVDPEVTQPVQFGATGDAAVVVPVEVLVMQRGSARSRSGCQPGRQLGRLRGYDRVGRQQNRVKPPAWSPTGRPSTKTRHQWWTPAEDKPVRRLRRRRRSRAGRQPARASRRRPASHRSSRGRPSGHRRQCP